MQKKTIADARTDLAGRQTGVNRRLLYLAAGDDVGCSVGLFWNNCDSFYLVDPEYGTGISYDNVLGKLRAGDGYLSGLRIDSSEAEAGYWEGREPGRRYQIWRRGNEARKKRLCFARSGTNAWLACTNTHYNVAINKDYDGITSDADRAFPYVDVWSRLNQYGIYGETIGVGRSSGAHDFAKYRYQGFEPLFEVTSSTGAQIGFAQGFTLFQKIIHADAAAYRRMEAELTRMETALRTKLGIFTEMADFGPGALEDEEDYAELSELMTNATSKNWAAFSATDRFADWLRDQLPTEFARISRDLVYDLVAPLRLNTWGSW